MLFALILLVALALSIHDAYGRRACSTRRGPAARPMLLWICTSAAAAAWLVMVGLAVPLAGVIALVSVPLLVNVAARIAWAVADRGAA